MDSTNGHSEKNQRKEKINVELKKGKLPSEMQELDLSDLPWKMQEEIRGFMDAFGLTEPPSIYSIDLEVDINMMPIDMLANTYRDAILEERFEDAEEIGEAIKKQNYAIDISEKMISLTYKK